MSLSSDVANFLKEREDLFDNANTGRKTTKSVNQQQLAQISNSLGAQQSSSNLDWNKGLANFLGDTLWSAVDTGLMGLPSLIAAKDEDILGVDLFDAPEVESQYAAAIGSMIGFVNPYGIPLKLGGKAAQIAASPFIKKAGQSTVNSAGRLVSKRIGEMTASGQISSSAARYANRELNPLNIVGGAKSTNVIKTMSDFAKWNGKTGTNWNSYAIKHIDEAVQVGVSKGLIKNNKEAIAIADAFKKECLF